MDVVLTADQELFRDTTRRYLEAQCPLSTVRRWHDHPAGFEPDYWRQGARLGWTSLLVPEDDGGGAISEHGLADLMIVAEEMGRLVSPGPLVSTNLAALAIASLADRQRRGELLTGLLAGELIGALAFGERGIGWAPARITCRAEPTGDGYRLTGCKTPVEAAAQAGIIVVTARTAVGLAQFLVPADAAGVTIEPLDSLDLVRRFAAVHLDGVVVASRDVLTGSGTTADMTPAVEHQLAIANVLLCAESCGVMQRVLDFTIEYLGDRYSFGRTLASYQALKHRCADWKLRLESSHGITTAAARALATGDAAAAELVSAAKSYVGTVATELIQDCVQLHGGIGVTWEHDLHLYLRRATLNRGLYGSPSEHRERIAAGLGLEAVDLEEQS